MARIPGIDSVWALLQAQTEALASLPEVVTSLTQAVRGLGDTVVQTRETIQAVQRLAVRLDALVEELEEPLRALRPGLMRLAEVLDDPIIGEVPDTLRQIQSDVLPVIRTLAETHEKVAFIAGSTDRIMTFVDETSRTFASLPGAGLLGRRRAAGGPVPPRVITVEQGTPHVPRPQPGDQPGDQPES
ncbi:MAG: uncharacterized protein JWN57_2339 [Frankiales bacterium]|nr:uncharacterized protein [Frankiales bacterium]